MPSLVVKSKVFLELFFLILLGTPSKTEKNVKGNPNNKKHLTL